jgi:CRISPR/Cas system CMR-associated protein Cmr3 (group 5 of RAMP superfamily)
MNGEKWVVLEPLDTIVVRDGRAFDAGLQSVARTSVPTPGTLAGAIGAAFGARPGAGHEPDARGRDVPDRLLGPVPVVNRGGQWRARWPVPLDVVRDDDRPSPYRLTITGQDEPPGDQGGVSHDLDNEVRGLLTGAGDHVAGWWETAELAGYLADGDVSGDTMPEPWRIERRVGLALDDDRTAADGMLYSAEHLRPAERMGFAVCCIGGPDVHLPETVPLGGRSRSAQVHADVKAPALPEPTAHAPDGRLLLYLATPAVFEHGWRPALTEWPGAELITAAVGDPQVIAAATPDRATGAVGRGRLMWAAPAGSVYYLKFGREQDALDAARTLNRRTLPQAEESLATAGFGYALTGTW